MELGGYGVWTALRPLLEATERIVVATGILNVWRSEQQQVAGEFEELSGEFPERGRPGL